MQKLKIKSQNYFYIFNTSPILYNWNIIGHEKELSRFEDDIISQTVHHAYLFVGPEKIGKFRVAKVAAGILQCPNNFCRKCPTCIQIEKKSHVDTIELEDDGESIKIGDIRDIITRLNMTGQSRYKILLIQNIGRLTDEAGNCLLKTLEEPPNKTIFLFSAGQLRDIMPTIASRMRIVHFRKLPDEVLAAALGKLYPDIDDDTLEQVLLLSLGRSGRALQLLSNPENFQEMRELYRHIQFLDEKASFAARMLSIQALVGDPKKTHIFLSILILYLRRAVFREKIPKRRMHLIEIIEGIHIMMGLLARNVNSRLLLENIMLKW